MDPHTALWVHNPRVLQTPEGRHHPRLATCKQSGATGLACEDVSEDVSEEDVYPSEVSRPSETKAGISPLM